MRWFVIAGILALTACAGAGPSASVYTPGNTAPARPAGPDMPAGKGNPYHDPGFDAYCRTHPGNGVC